MTRIYLYYLKSERYSLYAYTDKEKYADLFESQRDMKLFKFRSEKVSEEEIQELRSKYPELEMIDIMLLDDDKELHIIGTYYENGVLDESCDRLSSDMSFYLSYFSELDELNHKTKKILKKATNISKKKESGFNSEGFSTYDLELQINTFKLFYYLFKKTFIKNKEG